MPFGLGRDDERFFSRWCDDDCQWRRRGGLTRKDPQRAKGAPYTLTKSAAPYQPCAAAFKSNAVADEIANCNGMSQPGLCQ